ncbi:MAG: DNA-formamidopyrimidine glycosylase, partial [Patescibacteria group bacterium]
DTRKFGKMTLINAKEISTSRHLKNLGPEPLHETFTFKEFKERLTKKPQGKIKTVLMDQSILVGIGNIYSDEILWYAGVNPERKISNLTLDEIKKMFKAMKETLNKGIDFGGDSMSDYRNIYGLRGEFQMHHQAYRRKGEKCRKKNCPGVIMRKIINGRSAHFCNAHQI